MENQSLGDRIDRNVNGHNYDCSTTTGRSMEEAISGCLEAERPARIPSLTAISSTSLSRF